LQGLHFLHRIFISTIHLEFTMVKKVNKAAATKSSGLNPAALAENIKASAQQIYLAGLAQFSKAQQNGGNVFETMVKEGLAVQRKTQAAAEERISEVTNRAAGVANEVAAKATGQWNKLEDIFEDRVARALNKLGVPSAKDIETLIKRIDSLSKQVGTKSTAAAKPVRAAAKTVKAKAATAVKAVKKAAPVKRARKAA
jgi:poly(hydroxyalkanoate) granule-associated protein